MAKQTLILTPWQIQAVADQTKGAVGNVILMGPMDGGRTVQVTYATADHELQTIQITARKPVTT